MSVRLQQWIHKLDVGAGNTVIRSVAGVAAVLFAAALYNMAALTNLNSPEGMDQAQLARNLARGEGFSTSFIRPLSMHLVYTRATNQIGVAGGNDGSSGEAASPSGVERIWLDRLQHHHPDLAHPPLYPLLLAGVLKLVPTASGALGREPQTATFAKLDLWIVGLNQVLFLLVVLLTFRLAAKLFDRSVAWVSCVALVGSDTFWHLTNAGHSMLLLTLLFLALTKVIVDLEEASRAEAEITGRALRLAVMAGVLVGLASLTRYTALLLALPLIGLMATLPPRRKAPLVIAFLSVFLAILGPWLARNYNLSGTFFGTAGYGLFLDTPSFPGDTLERSVHPDFREFTVGELKGKFFANLRWLFQKEIPQLGGSWLGAFFLVGLLVPFRNPVLGRVRLFTVASLALLSLARCLDGRLLAESVLETGPDRSMALVIPMVFVFGVSLFFTLLDQLSSRIPGVRWSAVGVFCLFLVAPILLAFASPVRSRSLFPPYYPPWIEEKAGLLGTNDWMMSDVPWATAWYGDRESVWVTPYYAYPIEGQYRNDFYEIHERFHSIKALYLTAKTTERVRTAPLQAWIGRAEDGRSWEDYVWDWETFVLLGIFQRNEVPSGFPLQNAPAGIFPEIFLVDSERIEGK